VTITDRLKSDLVIAMPERDRVRVSTIRSLIAAIDNAGAVPVERQGYDYDLKTGLGHDVVRRTVTDSDIIRIIASERDDLAAVRDQYLELGETTHADELERRVAIAGSYLI